MKFSWRKVLNLYGQICFYSLAGFVAWYIIEPDTFSSKAIKIDGGWFGGCYLMLMFFAPLLNAAVDYYEKQGNEMLGRVWMILALGVFFAWGPLRLITGVNPIGVESGSFFTLVFIYLTARMARKFFVKPIPLKHLLVAGFLMFFAMVVFITAAKYCSMVDMGFAKSRLAPYSYGLSLVSFLIFVWHINIPKWLGRFCLFLGPSMFVVYLIHDVTHIGRLLYIIPQKWMYERTSIHPFFIVLISALLAFFICLTIDLVRRLLVAGFLKSLENISS